MFSPRAAVADLKAVVQADFDVDVHALHLGFGFQCLTSFLFRLRGEDNWL